MNRDVRQAVMERADGRCEACGQWFGERLQCDHAFGRKHAEETVRTCWALCPTDHQAKTLNEPSRIHWMWQFAIHCALHGYKLEQERAEKEIAWSRAKKGAA